MSDGSEARGPQTGRSLSRVTRVVLYAAVVCAVVSTVLWARLAVKRVPYPYQIDYGEGILLDNARTIASGARLYPASTAPPYAPCVYSPLYPALWGLIYPLGPLSFWPGRLLALLALLGAAVCVLVVVWARTRWWVPAVIAAGFFLSLHPIRVWTALARVDTLALVLSFVGWAVFVYARRLRWLGALLMVAALFARQSMIAAPIAALVAVAWAGERRSALLHLVLMAVVGLAGLGALQVLTGGAFTRDAVGGVMDRWELSLLWTGGVRGIWRLTLLLPAALACWVALRDREMRAVALYAVTSGLLVLTAGKVGSDVNYYLEFGAVASIALGLLLARDWHLRRGWPSPVLLLGLFAAANMVTAPLTRTRPELHPRQDAALAAAVAHTRGDVLSEWMGPVVQAGKTLWTEPFATTQMALAGRWDQRPLLRLIRQRHFALVVMSDASRRRSGYRYELWTNQELKAVAQNYSPASRVGSYWLLKPRGGAASANKPATGPPAARATHPKRG